MKTCALLVCSYSPSYNLPNAKPAVSAYQIGIGAGSGFLRAGPLPSVRINGETSFGPLTINANATLYQGTSSEFFNNVGLRYLVVDTASFKLAPFLTMTHFSGESLRNTRITDRLGLSMMTVGKKWSWDLSASVYGHQYFPNTNKGWSTLNVFDTAFASEMGVSRQITANHAVRIGLLGPIQTISHFWKLPKGSLKSTAGLLGDQGFVQFEYFIR